MINKCSAPMHNDQPTVLHQLSSSPPDGVTCNAVALSKFRLGRQLPSGRQEAGRDIGLDVICHLAPHGRWPVMRDAVRPVTQRHEATVDST